MGLTLPSCWRCKPWLSPLIILFPACFVGQLFLCQFVGDQQNWVLSFGIQMPSLLFWPLLTWLVAWQSAAVWPAVGLGVLTFILVFSFGFPLAGCAEKAAAASQFSFQDDCPAGWILYGGQCHLVMAASQSWASAAAYCGQQHADLLVLDSPDAAAYFGLLASERGIVRYWTGLQSNVSASWEALNHVPAGYRPWADLAMSVIPHRCPAALPSGVLEGRACTESLPFVCQRRVMWFTLEATCYESSLPTVRPEVWKNDLHFIRFADNDWVIDQASVRSYVDETNTYCVAPVVLRNASLVRSHCNGYDVVATCYSEVVGQCGPAQLDACGWNYPAGGFARVYRSTAAYPEMENFDADAFEQAALQLPLKNQGYARLYVSWVPQLTPYEFADIASREEQCVFIQWVAYASVYSALFGIGVLATLLYYIHRHLERHRQTMALTMGRARSLTPVSVDVQTPGDVTPANLANPCCSPPPNPVFTKSMSLWTRKMDESVDDFPLTPQPSNALAKTI